MFFSPLLSLRELISVLLFSASNKKSTTSIMFYK
jgi:hypothetical protein